MVQHTRNNPSETQRTLPLSKSSNTVSRPAATNSQRKTVPSTSRIVPASTEQSNPKAPGTIRTRPQSASGALRRRSQDAKLVRRGLLPIEAKIKSEALNDSEKAKKTRSLDEDKSGEEEVLKSQPLTFEDNERQLSNASSDQDQNQTAGREENAVDIPQKTQRDPPALLQTQSAASFSDSPGSFTNGSEHVVVHTRSPDVAELEAKYIFGKKIGEGAFGVVRVVQERATKMVYACKAVAKKKDSPYMYNQMLGEINIMKQVRHPHIIRMNEVYETPKKVYIIMEYCRGGELAQKVRARRTWSEEEARIIMARLVNAVAYLHDNGIVHRDIKAENVLLSTDIPNDPFNIKVSDFGLATSTDACTMMESVVGTPLYMAPEIIQNLPYSAQCDVWSIGIMMYLLICGYRYDAELAVKRMICDGKITYPEKYWANVHPAARSLSEAMLKFDPAKRISAKEVLRHPWITGECTDPNKSNTSLFTKTVLDLMRSYNNEKRLRRAFLVAQAAVRLWRGRDCLRRWS